MWFLCLRLMTPCFLIIIVLLRYYVWFQRFSRKLCLIDCKNFSMTSICYMKKRFGFRRNHFTHMAHIVLMDKIVHALENGECVIGLYLDFSKAFDTVNHAILLDKWEHCGICGNSLSRFKCYLTNRRQLVTYTNIKSVEKIISCGVPQGSILGPLFFFSNLYQQATGLDAWASRVKCPARFVSHLHDICIYMSCL